MSLKNVPRLRDVNIGGSTQLLYASIDMLNASAWPKRNFGTLDLVGNIVFDASEQWYYIDAVRETISAQEKPKVTGMYEHAASCFVAGDNSEMSALFDYMTYLRFVVLRKDANGHWCVKGTPKEPLRFTYRKISRDRVTQLKGYELDFAGMCTKPELYYTGDLALRTTVNDDVRVTIDGNFRTTI